VTDLAVTSKRLQFAHALTHAVRETVFRLDQLLEACVSSRARFEAGKASLDGEGRTVNFHFAAFAAVVQTFKDVLPVVGDGQIKWADFETIQHMEFMQSIRNAITHDGTPVINGWIDGRFYVICDFVRMGQGGKPVLIRAPEQDIATLAVDFAVGLSATITVAIGKLGDLAALEGPVYGEEFFRAAARHPAVPEFARPLIETADLHSSAQQGEGYTLQVMSELGLLQACCGRWSARVAA
jgi:hypothetical protein